MRKIIYAILFSTTLGFHMNAQVGIGTTSPNLSSSLDVSSLNTGVLIPRVSLTATTVAAPVTTPATSLLVYNINTAGDVTPGYYYWNGVWVRLATGNPWTITSNNFNNTGTQSIVTSIPSTITSARAAWLVGTNTATTNANTVTGFLGTSTNQHIDLVSNNLVRGRLSNLGEFFIGTTNTVLAGDLMNGVGNVVFPWAVNGYSSFNGSGTYGQITSGTTVFGGVQGEYNGTSLTGAGVRGISFNQSTGVSGQEISFNGWAVRADGDVGTTGNYFLISDGRLKKDIAPIEKALDKILKIEGVSYHYDTEKYKKYSLNPRHQLGFIAQDLEKVLPEAVATKNLSTTNTSREEGGKDVEVMQVKTVNLDAVIPVLVEAIKEQQAQIEDLKKEIQLLKNNTKP
jgi:hypothetical protein